MYKFSALTVSAVLFATASFAEEDQGNRSYAAGMVESIKSAVADRSVGTTAREVSGEGARSDSGWGNQGELPVSGGKPGKPNDD